MAVLAAAAVGCGCSSSSASLNSGDVAVVDNATHPATSSNHRIKLLVSSTRLRARRAPGGYAAYKTQVIDRSVQSLVLAAQVQAIADQLGVSVTADEVNNGSSRRSRELRRIRPSTSRRSRRPGYTQQDVFDRFRCRCTRAGIGKKLAGRVAGQRAAALKLLQRPQVDVPCHQTTRAR